MSEIPAHAPMNPEMRAAATAGAEPLDRISLRGYVDKVEIGAFQVERGKRQRVEFNVVAEVVPREDTDEDLDSIVSYDRLTEAITHELELERINLLETLAERIANRILREPRVVRVLVRIEKLDRGPGRTRSRDRTVTWSVISAFGGDFWETVCPSDGDLSDRDGGPLRQTVCRHRSVGYNWPPARHLLCGFERDSGTAFGGSVGMSAYRPAHDRADCVASFRA